MPDRSHLSRPRRLLPPSNVAETVSANPAPPSRVLVVINPLSGGAGAAVEEVPRALRSRFDTEVVHEPAEGAERVRSLPDDGSAAVVVCGGDGTVSRLLPDLVARNAALAVYPAGTVNDLARELGMGPGPERLVERLASADVGRMDLLRVGGHLVATYASIGLGARISVWAGRTRSLAGPLRRVAPFLVAPSYAAATILLDGHYRRTLSVRLGGSQRVERLSGVFLANQGHLNGNVLMSETASNVDGLLEVYLLKETRRLALLRAIYRLQSTRDRRTVESSLPVRTTDRVTLSAADGAPFSVFGDGELLCEARRLEVEVAPRALRVYRGPDARSRLAVRSASP